MSVEQEHAQEARELRRENEDLRAQLAALADAFCWSADKQRELQDQRDELAQALRRLTRAYEKVTQRQNTPLLNQARAALAKVKP